MRIGVIIDHGALRKWQADALLKLADDAQFLVYDCTNAPPAPRKLRHAPYYALNLLSLRSRQTARVRIPDRLTIIDRTRFECEIDGAWQKLPQVLLDRIEADRPDLLVKFGMGLLRVPPNLRLPILSYHHGDPRAFRGRPAGFYELLTGRASVGQVVQILSDRLDAGEVVAFGETKAEAYSWRRTMVDAYCASPLLLPVAVRNVLAGNRIAMDRAGKNYRLPSALTVLRFVAGRAAAAVKRMAYGVCVEKVWEVAEAPMPGDADLPADFPDQSQWQKVDRPRGYRFLADPFPHPDGGLLVEGLRSSTGRGEILHIDSAGGRVLLNGKVHYSYPASICIGGTRYLVPEVSEWSLPLLFRLSGDAAEPLGELKVAGRPRLIDPTLVERGGTIFLFANDASEGDGVLRLWIGDRVEGEFAEHPASPILISPAGARMGGAIFERGGALFRTGQDFRRHYGDGLLLFQIEELSRNAYRERAVGELRFSDRRGPHTLNFAPGKVIFDFYRDRFSPTAGLRRLRSALAQPTG